MKQCLLGIWRLTRVDRLRVFGSWELTELKLEKNESRHQETQGASGEKERYLRERCWMAVKNAANWLSCFQYQVQLELALALILLALMLATQLSQHTGRETGQWRIWARGGWRGRRDCMTVRRVFIMERLALMIYKYVLCIGVVHCSGAVVFSRMASGCSASTYCDSRSFLLERKLFLLLR